MTDVTTDVTTTVDTYFDMWNEDDPTTRARLIERAWTSDGRYVDPLLEADGHEALSAMVETVHQHYPGQRFARTSGVDAHHGLARFSWQLAGPDGAVTVAGIDVAELGADGRLRRITGFFGDLPGRDAG